VVENENGTLFERQAAKGAIELIAVMDRQDVLGLHVLGHRNDSYLRVQAAAAPRLCVALVNQDSVKPRLKSTGLAERAQLAPGLDHRSLDGVIGKIRVAQYPERDRHALITDCAHEVIESLAVARPRAFDEHCVHPFSLMAIRHSDEITLESRGPRPKVPCSSRRVRFSVK
jgi:hypothetical protein